jgi:hypothetical protein
MSSHGKRQGVRVEFANGMLYGERDEDVLPLVSFAGHSDHEEVDVQALKDDLWMGVCASYLVDMADCVTKGAQWRVDHTNCQNQALLVVDGDFSGVIMPLRVDLPKPAQVAEPVAPAALPGPQVAETGQEAAQAPETGPQEAPAGPEAAQVAETGQEGPQAPENGPETAPVEPCPAAVAAMAANLVESAQKSAKKAPRKARKAAQVAPVAEAGQDGPKAPEAAPAEPVAA